MHEHLRSSACIGGFSQPASYRLRKDLFSNSEVRVHLPLHVTVIGAGMIVRDQLLPALLHLRRIGEVGTITVCARRAGALRALASDPQLRRAFPERRFTGVTAPYAQALRRAAPDGLAVVAVPDDLHFPVIRTALTCGQHVLSVKPLVLRRREAVAIERLARARGRFVGVEYHKRFDRRALEAREKYRGGRFGEFRCGEAKLIEPWYYRRSRFQSWFAKKRTDPFVYIGCHYVDLVCFITGLRPVEVSVRGVDGRFPNGRAAWLWSAGRVRFENGSLLSVVNGLGYPDEGAGSNDQGMCLYCEGPRGGALIRHDDHFRGVMHAYARRDAHGAAFRFVNPDYFRYVPWEGPALKPVGYGYDSVEASVRAAARVSAAGTPARRRAVLAEIDKRGLIATPANSFVNELVVEAARLSIANAGRRAVIEYGSRPRARLG